MKRRFSLFTYPMMDMKAAETELNRRAAAGWQLEKVWMGVLAVFVPAHVPVCWRGMRVCGTSGAGSERRRLTGENRDGCFSGGIHCFG